MSLMAWYISIGIVISTLVQAKQLVRNVMAYRSKEYHHEYQLREILGQLLFIALGIPFWPLLVVAVCTLLLSRVENLKLDTNSPSDLNHKPHIA